MGRRGADAPRTRPCGKSSNISWAACGALTVTDQSNAPCNSSPEMGACADCERSLSGAPSGIKVISAPGTARLPDNCHWCNQSWLICRCAGTQERSNNCHGGNPDPATERRLLRNPAGTRVVGLPLGVRRQWCWLASDQGGSRGPVAT